MRCEDCREALSARVDGEPEGFAASAVDRHLESCAACRAWERRLWDTAGAMRVASAEIVPDLSSRILSDARRPHPPSASWMRWIRGGLLAVAVAQLVTAVLTLSDSSSHGAREHAAWEAALAVGLLVVTVRPRATDGVLPVAATVGLVLLAAAAVDLAADRTTWAKEAEHLLVLAAVALLLPLRGSTGRHQVGPA